MNVDTHLSPSDIKQKTAALNAEFEQMRQQAARAERRACEIVAEIADLQRECPHPSTTQQMVMDVAETKLRNFCDCCGKQV